MWTENIELPFRYDFSFVLDRMGEDPLIRLDKQEQWVDVPLVLHGNEREVARVQSTGTRDAPEFRVTGERDRDTVVNRLYEIFQWDVDLEKMDAHFLGTSLADLQKKFPATPVVRSFHMYDALMRVIIHQQLNKTFAYRLSTRFVENFGEKEKGVWFYPSPEKVASLAYDDLRELQFSQRKAEYVIDTSGKIARGELELNDFEQIGAEDTITQLTKVRGIGKWTAQNWQMRALGRADLFPEADVGIQNAWKLYFGKESKPSQEEMLRVSREWAPYRSYASLLLWRSLMEQ